MEKWLKCDFHIHASEDLEDKKHGTDIKYSAYGLVDAAYQQGYDVLCFAFHDRRFFPRELVSYAKKKNILLIPSIEKTIENRHVLFLNVKDELKRIKNLDDLSRVPFGVFIIAPHLFYPLAKSLGLKSLKYMNYFDAIELHSMYFDFFNVLNWLAILLAKKYNKPAIASSDSHFRSQFGRTYTLVFSEKNSCSVFRAIRRKEVRVISRPLPFFGFMGEFFRN